MKFNNSFNFTLKINANSANMFYIFLDGNVLLRKQSNSCSFVKGLPAFKSQGKEKHALCSIIVSTLALNEMQRRTDRVMLKYCHSSENPILHSMKFQKVLQMTLYIKVRCPHLSKQPGRLGEMGACRVTYGPVLFFLPKSWSVFVYLSVDVSYYLSCILCCVILWQIFFFF